MSATSRRSWMVAASAWSRSSSIASASSTVKASSFSIPPSFSFAAPLDLVGRHVMHVPMRMIIRARPPREPPTTTNMLIAASSDAPEDKAAVSLLSTTDTGTTAGGSIATTVTPRALERDSVVCASSVAAIVDWACRIVRLVAISAVTRTLATATASVIILGLTVSPSTVAKLFLNPS